MNVQCYFRRFLAGIQNDISVFDEKERQTEVRMQPTHKTSAVLVAQEARTQITQVATADSSNFKYVGPIVIT